MLLQKLSRSEVTSSKILEQNKSRARPSTVSKCDSHARASAS